MRIGLVTPAWPGINTANGITTSIANTRRGLEACGHEVCVIALHIDAAHGDPRVIEAPAREWRLAERLRGRLGDLDVAQEIMEDRLVRAVREAVDRHGIEIVMIEETWGWAGALQRRVPIPVVMTLRGPWFLHKAVQSRPEARREDARREAREARALHLVAGVTAPSADVMEATHAACGIPAETPRRVIPNPMPLGEPIDLAGRGTELLDRMLFVGRFDLHKGGDVALEGFARLAARRPGCRLTFVGPDRGIPREGGGALHVEEALAALPAGVRERIDWLGPRSKAEVDALRRSHGIAIVASRYENFGNVILEAMAVGSAIVSTAVGGSVELIRHEETGLLIPPDDPEALADACAQLLDHPALAARLGAAARDEVARRLTPEAVGRDLADFLGMTSRRFMSVRRGAGVAAGRSRRC